MPKNYLLTPGPTSVPAEVLLSMAHPIFHHRTPRFKAIMKETIARAKRVLMTNNDVAVLTSSGTGAMEMAVANLASSGRKALTVEGGKFGERWSELCEAFGLEYEAIKVEWGTAVDPKTIEEKLAADASIAAVFITQSETSTGVLTDVKAIGEIVAKTDAALVVDGISSVGACEMRTDDWKVDILCVGSQKGLMLPPGLGLIAVSAKAKALVEKSDAPKAYYFDMLKNLKSATKDDTPFTPALTLVIGLNEAMKMMEEEGLENLFKRHAVLSEAVRTGIKAMGLEMFSQAPAESVTSIKVPEGVDGAKLAKDLRDTHGVAFAGGQAHLKGKILRIATMGYCGRYDVMIGMSALEMGLAEAGHSVELGSGVKAAEGVLVNSGIY